MKRQTIGCNKVFTSCTFEKGRMSRIHRELSKHCNKNINYKMGKRHQILHERGHVDDKYAHEKTLSITSHYRKANSSHDVKALSNY